MPAGLDLSGVEFLIFEIDPACPQRELFFQVLEVFIAPPVCADQRASFGVAWTVSAIPDSAAYSEWSWALCRQDGVGHEETVVERG